MDPQANHLLWAWHHRHAPVGREAERRTGCGWYLEQPGSHLEDLATNQSRGLLNAAPMLSHLISYKLPIAYVGMGNRTILQPHECPAAGDVSLDVYIYA